MLQAIKKFMTPYMQGEMYQDLDKEQKAIVNEYNDKIHNGAYKTEEVACLCGKKENTKLTDVDRYGFWHPVVICEACGFMYATPRPVWEVLEEFYKSGSYRKVYGGVEFEESKYEEHVNNSRMILVELTDLLVIRKLQSVFDFGCAGGWNLLVFKELGMKVSGCDFDPTLIELGRKRGLDLQIGSFELLEGKRFDLIILNHVVEHFNDFWKDMAIIREAMSPNGLLYIALPNMSMFGCNRLQNAHNYYFKRSHLDFFMRHIGFKRLSTASMFEFQDFFAIYDLSDDILMKHLEHDKEIFKGFLRRINILK